jgi:hypothetical protein
VLACLPAWGQRVQFPSPLSSEPPVYAGPVATPHGAGAALQGSIQPDSGWDPYAAATPEPPALYPEGGYVQPYLDGTQPPRQRLLHQVGVEGTYLARFNTRGFGVTDAGVYATFAMPFLYNPAPIYLTPGFTYHAWDGPDPAAFVGAPDLPPNAYDAYLDASWKPVITTWFSGDLGVRVGVYSDFDRVNSDSIRIIGRGLGVVTFNDRWQAAAGIWYLDRLRVKLLPAGGVIWTPNPDVRYEILFPNPKLAQRITNLGNAEIWGYVAGEYGGGSWTIERTSGLADRMDYNDIRAMLGVEYRGFERVTGYFEVGYIFSREILYISGTPDIKPTDTYMLRGGISF